MPQQPNIILILSDQHNPAVAGYEGDEFVQTPNLDRLAASGAQLRNAYCGSPLCVPSRISMLSSLLPSRTGVQCNSQSLYSDIPTFVHSLTLAGYDTALAGRMHFVGPDQRHGYAERLVGDITAVRLGAPNPTFGEWGFSTGQSYAAVELSGPGNSGIIEYDRAVTAAAVAWLRESRGESPYFLTVGTYGPHCTYVCPRPQFERYMDILPAPSCPEGFAESVHPAIRKWLENRNMLGPSPDAVRRARAAYYGLVELLDGYVGELLAAVDANGGLENTLVIYTSDHGDMIGHNGLFWKSNFYEGSVRVPLLLSWPGVIPDGLTLTELTSHLDLGPTLCDLTGAPELPETDGRNLWPAIAGEEPLDPDRAVVSMLGDVKGDAPVAMVRRGPWKLVSFHGYEHVQLFHLEQDPAEQRDLGRDPDCAGVRDELLGELDRVWDSDEAAVQVEQAQRRAQMITKWNRYVPPPPDEEFWRGDSGMNRIEEL